MKKIDKKLIFEILKNHENKINFFGVKKIGLFGSFAYGIENENSDIDFLVEFYENQVTFDNYFDLKFFLENIFQRKIDLVTSKSIKIPLRESILKSVIYVS